MSWHHTLPAASWPRARVTAIGTGTSTSCSTSWLRLGEQRALRMESWMILSTSITCTTMSMTFRISISWSTISGQGSSRMRTGTKVSMICSTVCRVCPLLQPHLNDRCRPPPGCKPATRLRRHREVLGGCSSGGR